MNVVPFSFNEAEVRSVIGDDGEPWFVAKDVTNILKIENASDTINKMLDDDEFLKLNQILKDRKYLPSGVRYDAIIVNESGLYNLIFRSYKDEAKAFRRWVTKEVLPTIRKTGGYSAGDSYDMLGFYAEYQQLNPNYEFSIEFEGVKATAYQDATHGLLIDGVELSKLIGKSPKSLRVVKCYHKDIIRVGEAFVKLGQTTYYTKKGIELMSLHSRNKEFARYALNSLFRGSMNQLSYEVA